MVGSKGGAPLEDWYEDDQIIRTVLSPSDVNGTVPEAGNVDKAQLEADRKDEASLEAGSEHRTPLEAGNEVGAQEKQLAPEELTARLAGCWISFWQLLGGQVKLMSDQKQRK